MARHPDTQPPSHADPARRLARRSLVLVVAVALGFAALMLHAPSRRVFIQLMHEGQRRELEPALFQGAPLRSRNGGRDQAYLIGTQSEEVLTVSRRSPHVTRRHYLHVDLWAVDASLGKVAWRKRLRSYEGRQREGRVLTDFELLGVDGDTLWVNVEGPLAISLPDGGLRADGARIDAVNPRLAGRRVDERGYVAFGRNGLQLTLDDASQWRIDAHDLSAAPRDTPVRHPERIVAPAPRRSTSAFQVRAIPIGDRWIGLLTDGEARHLSTPPRVPGRGPDERPGAMQQYLEAQHVPAPLHQPLPQPYRLWSAHVEQVSAAPPDWPKDWPDNWGTRPRFSDYAVLPASPVFLRAGLLRPHPDSDIPFWYREPDSVLVLHSGKLGEAGRLELTRVAGPRGDVAWRVPLPSSELLSVMHADGDLLLLGQEPVAHEHGEERLHTRLVRIDVARGTARALDLTAESLRPETSDAAASPR